jgi:hypothetical protein
MEIDTIGLNTRARAPNRSRVYVLPQGIPYPNYLVCFLTGIRKHPEMYEKSGGLLIIWLTTVYDLTLHSGCISNLSAARLSKSATALSMLKAFVMEPDNFSLEPKQIRSCISRYRTDYCLLLIMARVDPAISCPAEPDRSRRARCRCCRHRRR